MMVTQKIVLIYSRKDIDIAVANLNKDDWRIMTVSAITENIMVLLCEKMYER